MAAVVSTLPLDIVLHHVRLHLLGGWAMLSVLSREYNGVNPTVPITTLICRANGLKELKCHIQHLQNTGHTFHPACRLLVQRGTPAEKLLVPLNYLYEMGIREVSTLPSDCDNYRPIALGLTRASYSKVPPYSISLVVGDNGIRDVPLYQYDTVVHKGLHMYSLISKLADGPLLAHIKTAADLQHLNLMTWTAGNSVYDKQYKAPWYKRKPFNLSGAYRFLQNSPSPYRPPKTLITSVLVVCECGWERITDGITLETQFFIGVAHPLELVILGTWLLCNPTVATQVLDKLVVSPLVSEELGKGIQDYLDFIRGKTSTILHNSSGLYLTFCELMIWYLYKIINPAIGGAVTIPWESAHALPDMVQAHSLVGHHFILLSRIWQDYPYHSLKHLPASWFLEMCSNHSAHCNNMCVHLTRALEKMRETPCKLFYNGLSLLLHRSDGTVVISDFVRKVLQIYRSYDFSSMSMSNLEIILANLRVIITVANTHNLQQGFPNLLRLIQKIYLTTLAAYGFAARTLCPNFGELVQQIGVQTVKPDS